MATNFNHIQFNSTYHTYTLNGKRLNNVTKFISQFQKPFDRDGIARKQAQKYGRPVEEILAEWDAKGEAGRALGTRVHTHIQRTLTGQLDQADPFVSLNNLTPEETAFNEFWGYLRQVVDVDPGHIEWVIGDESLNLAGTVDSVLYYEETGLFHIVDWKTGRFDVVNPWQQLLPPFGDLADCKLNYYSLQVSLYKLILQRNTDMAMGDSYIVHLSSDGEYQVHKALDLCDRIDRAIGQF